MRIVYTVEQNRLGAEAEAPHSREEALRVADLVFAGEGETPRIVGTFDTREEAFAAVADEEIVCEAIPQPGGMVRYGIRVHDVYECELDDAGKQLSHEFIAGIGPEDPEEVYEMLFGDGEWDG